MNIKQFTPQAGLDAEAQLKRFIAWAKEAAEESRTLKEGRIHESFNWDDSSWHHYNIADVAFTKFGSTKANRIEMEAPFVDFAKAVIVERAIFRGNISSKSCLDALRAVEASLSEKGKSATKVKGVDCNRAFDWMQSRFKEHRTYLASLALANIIKLMRDEQLLEMEFTWESPLKINQSIPLDKREEFAQKKLPNRDALEALGEIFNHSDLSPLDAVVTSTCALLLAAPSRVGELADLTEDCLFYVEDHTNGEKRLFLRWYAEKISKRFTKPVNTGMESVARRAVAMMKWRNRSARRYAKWLEENPDTFPHHDGVPDKGPDEPLTYFEMLSALMYRTVDETGHRARFRKEFLIPLAKKKAVGEKAKKLLDEVLSQWDPKGDRVMNEKGYLERIDFNDRPITLRELNILMRARYLPKHFPYTTPIQNGKSRIKFSDALFTVRTGAMAEGSGAMTVKKPFGLEVASKSARISTMLSGTGNTVSIFDRHGYDGVRVNSHQFRHYINTEMHRAGLSQALIDLFSGRDSMGSVYNHESIQERTNRVALYHPEARGSNATRLEKIQTNQPLKLSDVTDLHGDEDRVIHESNLGLCVHNWAVTPCPKMGACLTCGKLACVKGDDVKLKNLKGYRERLNKKYERALKAKEDGAFGAERWLEKATADLAKCDALIEVLENPDFENGSIVWNRDNGWNLTNNAAVMGGLIPLEQVEAEIKESAVPSLDDLAAMNRIGG